MYTVCKRSASTVKKAYAKQEDRFAGFHAQFSQLSMQFAATPPVLAYESRSTIPPRHRFLGEEYVHFLRTKSRCQRNAAAERGGILDTLQQEADHKGEVEWEIHRN